MRTWVRVAAILSSLAAIPALTTGADAHAYVVGTSPGVNATVGSPDRVSVSFDEPITIESRQPLVVRDATGVVLPCAPAAYVNPEDVTQIVCTLARPLAGGTYTVAWRITSADTHVVHGVFSFGVGTAVNAAAGETHSVYDPSSVPATILRWLVLLASIAIAGAIGFDAIVLRDDFPSAASLAIDVLRLRCSLLVGWGIVIAMAASVGALDVQAAAATGTDALRALAHVDEILTSSVWGGMWLLRIGALTVIAALMHIGLRRLGGAACGVAGTLLATLSVSGHALVSQSARSVLPVAADWLHLTAAALWSAGVFVFALGLRAALAALPVSERDAFARQLIARFSALALPAVAAILITGVFGAILHLPTPAALVTTAYGAVILAKTVLVVPLLVLGYRNLRSGKPGSPNVDITATVTREAVVLVAVVTLSAVLTGLPLPHAPV